ncbi:MAG: Hsp33 family molecular chaperone HslO [Pseudomonadota bacterium]
MTDALRDDNDRLTDALRRFLFKDLPVRGVLLQLSDEWRSLRARHDYDDAVASLLGQASAAVVAIGSTMKFEGMLTIQLAGQGPLAMLIVQCDDHAQFRGMAGEVSGEGNDRFSALMGDGHLSLTVDARDAKDQYRGIVALGGETLAENLKTYYEESAQLQAHFVLLADNDHAVALMLQRLPDVEDLVADDWHRLCLLADTLTLDELRGGATTDLLQKIYAEDDIVVWPAAPVAFACRCDDERAERAVRMLGEADAMALLAERDNEIEIVCEFCNTKRTLDAVDVSRLFNPAAVPGDPAVH